MYTKKLEEAIRHVSELCSNSICGSECPIHKYMNANGICPFRVFPGAWDAQKVTRAIMLANALRKD